MVQFFSLCVIHRDRDASSPENPEFVKVEIQSSDDDLSHCNATVEIEAENQSKNLIVKLDDEMLKGIESGPVSR